MLEDIAILTGGEVITEELGLRLKNTRIAQLDGRGRRRTKDATTIVGGAGDAERWKTGSNNSRATEVTSADYDREKLNERLAKLAGGVAVIKVGAATDTELREKKHRVEEPSRRPARPSKRASCQEAACLCCTVRDR